MIEVNIDTRVMFGIFAAAINFKISNGTSSINSRTADLM